MPMVIIDPEGVEGMRTSHFIIAADDPDEGDGEAVGPGEFPDIITLLREGVFVGVVLWSGAFSKSIWDQITEGAMVLHKKSRRPTLIILTRVSHHAAWKAAVGRRYPLLEIHPDITPGRQAPLH